MQNTDSDTETLVHQELNLAWQEVGQAKHYPPNVNLGLTQKRLEFIKAWFENKEDSAMRIYDEIYPHRAELSWMDNAEREYQSNIIKTQGL